MTPPGAAQLSRRERQIMDILYRRGRATAGEVMADLPGGQEEWLAALAAALWPRDEYARIITELWREDQP